jgi:RNase P/RNase MRP subunit p30
VKGLAVYGEFVPEKDERCLSEELIEELLDCGSYLDFCEQKHPELRSAVQSIRAKVILLYGESKKLKELELTLSESG